MSANPPQYTLVEAMGICLAMCQRCMEEVRALTLVPGPKGEPGPAGPQGIPGAPGERGERGAVGTAARSWKHRRTYDQRQAYDDGDVVMHDGSSWLCLCDNAGPLPGDDWAQLSIKGQRGKPGDKGERGLTGPDGRGIADVSITENGDALVIKFTDGVERTISLVTR